MSHDAGSADPRLAVRFVDLHSGRNDVLGRMTSVSTMLATVTLRLEGGRAGSRFPLLQLVRRSAPLSPAECEALVREVTRLKSVLAPLSRSQRASVAEEPGSAPAATSAPRVDAMNGSSASDVATVAEIPEVCELFPRLNGNGAPKTLGDEFGWPLFVLDHVGRLGAASGRGARFESGDVDAFRAVRTPLSPYGPPAPAIGPSPVASR